MIFLLKPRSTGGFPTSHLWLPKGNFLLSGFQGRKALTGVIVMLNHRTMIPPDWLVHPVAGLLQDGTLPIQPCFSSAYSRQCCRVFILNEATTVKGMLAWSLKFEDGEKVDIRLKCHALGTTNSGHVWLSAIKLTLSNNHVCWYKFISPSDQSDSTPFTRHLPNFQPSFIFKKNCILSWSDICLAFACSNAMTQIHWNPMVPCWYIPNDVPTLSPLYLHLYRFGRKNGTLKIDSWLSCLLLDGCTLGIC